MSQPEPEPVGDINIVKELSGSHGPRSGMTDDMYVEIIRRWTGHVRTATQKYDWEPTDADFTTFRGIVERLAVADIRWSFDRTDKMAKGMHDSAMKDLEDMIGKSSDAGKPTVANISKGFESWPRNPSAIPYTSIKKNRPSGGINNSYDYPWRF